MKLFVDTGNLKEIEALAALGILDGVTTNPSLMAKETRRLPRRSSSRSARSCRARSAPKSWPPTPPA